MSRRPQLAASLRMVIAIVIIEYVRLRDRFRSSAARVRIQRATQARVRLRSTMSEVVSFALLGVISLVAGLFFMSGVPLTREIDDQLYSAALSLACLWNFVLFFIRFGHYAAMLGDIDRIDRLRQIIREGPPVGQFLHMQWKGPRPANDF